jgi:lycopene cyclase domain-containing protein
MKFYKKWGSLWPALLIVAALFIVWDHYFTLWGIWYFNPQFVVGWFVWGLPIEEWLFFLTIPYACMFVYETVRYYDWVELSSNFTIPLLGILIVSLLALAFVFNDRLYTCVTFSLAAISLAIHWLIFKAKFLSLFFVTYAIQIVPFLVVNGILTSWPVLIYNNNENLGIRMGTIPLEDAIYSLIILILNITIYELLYYNFKLKSEHSHG